jgi:hypothetical protein
MAEGVSPVLLVRLPDYQAPYTLTLYSAPGGWGRTKDIFVPSGLLFDEAFTLTRVLPENAFAVRESLMRGSHLQAVVPFDESHQGDRYLLVYTRADALGQRERVNVTSVGATTASGAVTGLAASVLASLLMRVERKPEGSVDLETRLVER